MRLTENRIWLFFDVCEMSEKQIKVFATQSSASYCIIILAKREQSKNNRQVIVGLHHFTMFYSLSLNVEYLSLLPSRNNLYRFKAIHRPLFQICWLSMRAVLVASPILFRVHLYWIFGSSHSIFCLHTAKAWQRSDAYCIMVSCDTLFILYKFGLKMLFTQLIVKLNRKQMPIE